MYKIGCAKTDITHLIKGVGMFGYGMHYHKAQYVKDHIYARTTVIEKNKTRIVISIIEIGAISFVLKRSIIEILTKRGIEIKHSNFILSATHTHNAPGGHFHYPFYNFSVPGFSKEILEGYANTIADSISEACNNMWEGNISYGEGSFEGEGALAYNRSIKAFISNKEMQGKRTPQLHEAIDPRMKMLKFEDTNGQLKSCINWFGVHTTSVGNDSFGITGDNKGFASWHLENYFIGQNSEVIAAFAQGCCGDISPNFRWNSKRKKMMGDHSDDYMSAKTNGSKQSEKAISICNQSSNSQSGNIRYIHSFVDFSDIKISPKYVDGIRNARTNKPCLGVSFFAGTTDGIGLPSPLVPIVRLISRVYRFKQRFMSNKSRSKAEIIEKYRIHGNKDIMLEASAGKLFGIKKLENLPKIDPTIATLKEHFRNGSINGKPLIAEVLPVQIVILGGIALVCLTCELTITAGKRIESFVLKKLEEIKVEHVIMVPYSNGYSGYVTTNEEYQVQCYEGGHTLYGQYTLSANIQQLDRLCDVLINDNDIHEADLVKEFIFPQKDIEKRVYNNLS